MDRTILDLFLGAQQNVYTYYLCCQRLVIDIVTQYY